MLYAFYILSILFYLWSIWADPSFSAGLPASTSPLFRIVERSLTAPATWAGFMVVETVSLFLFEDYILCVDNMHLFLQAQICIMTVLAFFAYISAQKQRR